MKCKACFMSLFVMPSRLDIRELGKVRKKYASPIRSSIYARCIPMHAGRCVSK